MIHSHQPSLSLSLVHAIFDPGESNSAQVNKVHPYHMLFPYDIIEIYDSYASCEAN